MDFPSVFQLSNSLKGETFQTTLIRTDQAATAVTGDLLDLLPVELEGDLGGLGSGGRPHVERVPVEPLDFAAPGAHVALALGHAALDHAGP